MYGKNDQESKIISGSFSEGEYHCFSRFIVGTFYRLDYELHGKRRFALEVTGEKNR